MPKRAVLTLLSVLAVVLASPGGAVDPQQKRTVEKTHPFTGDKDLPVGIKHGDVTIETVRIRNWPDADDFADAEKDLNETHTMVVEFTYSNRDEARDYKCRYAVIVPGPKGAAAFAENDRTATLTKGKIHDTNKVFVKMKTRRFKEVRSFKVTYEIWRK